MNLSNAVEFYSCLIAIMNHYGYDHQVYEKLPEEVDELQEAFGAYFDKPSRSIGTMFLKNALMSTSCSSNSRC